MKKWWKPALALAFAGLILLGLSQLPAKEWLEPLWDAIRQAGPWGYLIFVGVGTLAALCMLPISPVVLASGLLFGFWKGLGLILIVLMLSCSTGYWMGNGFWSKFSHWKLFQGRILSAVRKALEIEGAYLVGLLRMTPFIHYMVGNLFFGSLSIRFWPFLIASMLGMLPGTAIIVYAGYIARRSLGGDVDMNRWQLALFVAGVLIFIGISTLVTRKTRRILREDAGSA